FFVFQAEDGIRDFHVTGVQTCALPISAAEGVEKATCSGEPAGTFDFLGFHFLFKSIDQNAYSQNQCVERNNGSEPIGIALANKTEQQSPADCADYTGNQEGFK